MAMISFSPNGDTPFQQLLGHNKQVLEKWAALEACIYGSGTFSPNLIEEVRRSLAFHNGCEYCKAKGAPSQNIVDMRTQTAVHLAELCGQTAHLSDSEIHALKKVFTESEISELLALICFITACQRFGALLSLGPVCQI